MTLGGPVGGCEDDAYSGFRGSQVTIHGMVNSSSSGVHRTEDRDTRRDNTQPTPSSTPHQLTDNHANVRLVTLRKSYHGQGPSSDQKVLTASALLVKLRVSHPPFLLLIGSALTCEFDSSSILYKETGSRESRGETPQSMGSPEVRPPEINLRSPSYPSYSSRTRPQDTEQSSWAHTWWSRVTGILNLDDLPLVSPRWPRRTPIESHARKSFACSSLRATRTPAPSLSNRVRYQGLCVVSFPSPTVVIISPGGIACAVC